MGLTMPTAQDIQESLKDPESLASKYRNECQRAGMLHRGIVLYLLIFAQAVRLIEEALEDKKMLGAVLAQQKEALRHAEEQYAKVQDPTEYILRKEKERKDEDRTVTVVEKPPSPEMISLRDEMKVLLAEKQEDMDIPKLNQHHKDVTENFNKQILAGLRNKFGEKMTAPVKINNVELNIELKIPTTSKPTPSAAEILKITELPSSVDFAAHATQAGVGYIAVLKMWRETLENNREYLLKEFKIEDIDTIMPTPKSYKEIDRQATEDLDKMPTLLMHLFKNNLRATGHAAALDKLPPTFFNTRGKMTPAAPKIQEDEEKLKNKP